MSAVILATFCIAACAPPLQMPEFRPGAGETIRLQKTFAAIDEQNASVARSPAWLTRAHERIQLRSLHDLEIEEYESYQRYVAADGEAYIIVHPGYFPFFDVWDIPRPIPVSGPGPPARNLVDRIAESVPRSSSAYRAAIAQERVLRDFLEFMAQERRLVILVLPRDYHRHVTYGDMSSHDEYARYINDISDMGDNFVTIESAAFDQGHLLDPDLDVLLLFLKKARVRKVLLGGGFIDKCLSGFYGSLKHVALPGFVYFVPEITLFSPADMMEDNARLLTTDGALSRKAVYRYFQSFAWNPATEEMLPWTPFPFYDIERYR